MKKFKASDIHKTFDFPVSVPVLKGVSLEVAPGESVAIMGKSGEGKTTLLHILGALEPPSSGEVTIGSKTAASCRRSIGFIFQACNLLEDYTLLENLLMPARILRKNTKPGSEAFERVCKLLELTDLLHRKAFPIKLLSGGEKQRAAIARALVNDPDLILADEPSGHLDRANSDRIHQLLITLCKDFNKSLIVATHDMELAKLCDKTLHLKNGVLCDS
jgi:lipoprotein-releasing system ATP-binding protein